MFIDDVIKNKKEKGDIVDKFIKFCFTELKLEKPPKITLTKKRDDSFTTGYYNPSDCTIKVYVKDRAVCDFIRTIAHEIVHHKQNEEKRLQGKIQDIGGEIEDEANAVAGQLVKKFGYDNREIYH